MECRIIKDKKIAKSFFKIANNTNDYNSKNYNENYFEKSWQNWLNFYALYDTNKVVAFCGARKFDSKYVRIFDRYFITPEYRHKGLFHNEYYLKFIDILISDCEKYNFIPFFSIQNENKINSIKIAIKKINKYLKTNKFYLLNGLYCTAPNSRDSIDSWQNIAIQYPHTINLENKKWQKYKQ